MEEVPRAQINRDAKQTRSVRERMVAPSGGPAAKRAKSHRDCRFPFRASASTELARSFSILPLAFDIVDIGARGRQRESRSRSEENEGRGGGGGVALYSISIHPRTSPVAIPAAARCSLFGASADYANLINHPRSSAGLPHNALIERVSLLMDCIAARISRLFPLARYL
jgi:hypothetical protein